MEVLFKDIYPLKFLHSKNFGGHSLEVDPPKVLRTFRRASRCWPIISNVGSLPRRYRGAERGKREGKIPAEAGILLFPALLGYTFSISPTGRNYFLKK